MGWRGGERRGTHKQFVVSPGHLTALPHVLVLCTCVVVAVGLESLHDPFFLVFQSTSSIWAAQICPPNQSLSSDKEGREGGVKMHKARSSTSTEQSKQDQCRWFVTSAILMWMPNPWEEAELPLSSTTYTLFSGVQPLLDLCLNQLKYNAVEIFALQDLWFSEETVPLVSQNEL